MSVELYRECMIFPFSYNTAFWEEADGTDCLKGIFAQKAFVSNAYNSHGETLLTEKGRATSDLILNRYKLSDQGRKACQLSPKKNYQYPLSVGNRTYSFQIGEIEAWLFKAGTGFLTINIQSSFENIEKALEFRGTRWFSSHKSCFQWKKNEYTEGVITEKTVSLNMKQIVEKCMGVLQAVPLDEISGGAPSPYSMVLLQTDTSEELASEERLQKLCLRESLSRGAAHLDGEVSFYKYCDYIQWAVSKDSIAAWTDLETAGGNNRQFLSANFPNSVFTNYLALYLYYIVQQKNCEELEKIVSGIDSGETSLMSEENRQLFARIHTQLNPMAEGKFAQLDILLRTTLCEKQWKLTSRLKKLFEEDRFRIFRQKKHDVFISYRHDGGQYLALLLYEHLSARGKSVFWDKKSLRAGSFPEQLYQNLDECENVLVILSPNCLERLTEEGDWVRKELAYAFSTRTLDGKPKKKSNVLRIRMEGGDVIKDNTELPEEIRELADAHFIDEAKVEFFDGVVNQIIGCIDNNK